MKKILTLVLLGFNLILNAQTDLGVEIDKRAGKFYKSYEDYLKDESIAGVNLKEMSDNGWTLEITENGKTEKYKDTKVPYSWFCNLQGILMRVYDGNIYYVIIEGPLCYYAKYREAWVGHSVYVKTKKLCSDYSYLPNSNSSFSDYYSETINGEIKIFSNKYFKELLEKYGLKEQFEEDKIKREMKDSVMNIKNKEWNKRIKYIRLIFEKFK